MVLKHLILDQKFIHYAHSEFESDQKKASVKLGQDIFLFQSKMTGLKREIGSCYTIPNV